MIRYHRLSWWSQVFALRGGIFTSLWMPSLVYFLYALVVYLGPFLLNVDRVITDNDSHIQVLGSVVSFLLIFRLNQCYDRYKHGAYYTALFFSSLHAVASVACVYIKGPASRLGKPEGHVDQDKEAEKRDAAERLALQSRVHIVRLVLAIGASLQFHCRVAEHNLSGGVLEGSKVPLILFDLQRVKGLLLREEQRAVDEVSGIRLEDIIIKDKGKDQMDCKLRVCLNYRPTAGAEEEEEKDEEEPPPTSLLRAGGTLGVAVPLLLVLLLRDSSTSPWEPSGATRSRPAPATATAALLREISVGEVLGIVESQLQSIAMSFEEMDRLITFPLPMAYLQHCKVLFLTFVLIYPLTLPTSDGIVPNVMYPVLIFLALFGLDILADQIENPLNDAEAGFNVVDMQHELELRTLQAFAITETRRQYMRRGWSRLFPEPTRRASSSSGANSRRRSAGGPGGAATRDSCDVPDGGAGDFLAHFGWVEFPANVVEYMSAARDGQLADGHLASALRMPARCLLEQLGQLGQRATLFLQHVGYTRYEALEGISEDPPPNHDPHGVTHFVCLRHTRAEVHRVCRLIESSARRELLSTMVQVWSPAEIAAGMPQTRLRRLLQDILDPYAGGGSAPADSTAGVASRQPSWEIGFARQASSSRRSSRKGTVRFESREDEVSDVSEETGSSGGSELLHIPQGQTPRVSTIWALRTPAMRSRQMEGVSAAAAPPT